MQAPELPAVVLIDRLGSGQHHWQGEVPTDSMGRLFELAQTVENAQSSFSIDTTAARPVITGHCQAEIELVCERCLQPLTVSVRGDFELIAVDQMAEAELLNADQPVVVAPRGELDVIAMLEDELILGLPVVARHEAGACREVPMKFSPPGAEALAEKENPFDVLAGLKTKRSNDVE